MKIDSYAVVNDDSHLLCRSMYADSRGTCRAGLKSKNKGKPCKKNTDCPSVEDPNVFANCKCGWNDKKTRYCDLLPGDEEWLDVRARFLKYFEATKVNCNTEARWERCSEKTLHSDWMCHKLKAENYPYMIDEGSLSCMENLY